MNKRIEDNEPVKGNPEAIREMTDTLLKLVGMYVQSVPTTMIDYFLSINNLHKLVIADLATRWAQDSHPEERTYRMADLMFRESMKELRRALPVIGRSEKASASKAAESQLEAELASQLRSAPPSGLVSLSGIPLKSDLP